MLYLLLQMPVGVAAAVFISPARVTSLSAPKKQMAITTAIWYTSTDNHLLLKLRSKHFISDWRIVKVSKNKYLLKSESWPIRILKQSREAQPSCKREQHLKHCVLSFAWSGCMHEKLHVSLHANPVCFYECVLSQGLLFSNQEACESQGSVIRSQA